MRTRITLYVLLALLACTGHVRAQVLRQRQGDTWSHLTVQVEGDPRLSLALMEGILKHQQGRAPNAGVNRPNEVTISYDLPDPGTYHKTIVIVGVKPPAPEMYVNCVHSVPGRAEVICRDLVRRFSASR
jgi:hypothetical protein